MMNQKTYLLIVAVLGLSACTSSRPPETRMGGAAPIVDAAGGPSQQGGGTIAAPATPAAPGGGAYLPGDGPGKTLSNVDLIPDAVPKAEPLHRYANRPYSALGKTYTPLTQTGKYRARGTASWYGKKFHGQRTSIGEVYDMYSMTAAHPTLPIPSYARVTNLANGRTAIVRINDRGPFLHDRIMDLSYVAAYKLGYVNAGSAEVEVESIAVDANQPYSKPVEVRPLSRETTDNEVNIPVETADARSSKVYLQLGAFSIRQGADSYMAKMRSDIGETTKKLVLFEKDGLTRVHLGPYDSADEARKAAAGLAEQLGFKPFVSRH